jgi:hypothetical protein
MKRYAASPERGALGEVVFSRNRYGTYQRKRVPPKQPGTRAQRGTLESMADLSHVWNELGEERWLAWRRFVERLHRQNYFGHSARLDACALFKKLNRVLATCGRTPLLDPPPSRAFGPNPVIGFSITRDRHGPHFRLTLDPGVRWDARDPQEDLMVFGWTPLNGSVSSNGLYVFLGVSPPPEGRQIDFTGLYLKKLKEWRKLKPRRYHVPLDGARIFIRVCQQTNGWENEVGIFRDSFVVPPKTAATGWMSLQGKPRR